MWPFRARTKSKLMPLCGGVVTPAGPVEIRRCGPDDGRDVVRLLAALARHEGYPPPGFTYDGYREEVVSPNGSLRGFIARQGPQAVGYTLYHPAYDTQSGERGAYMVDLFVEEAMRGHGVGRALMGAVARSAAGWGGSFLWWSAKSGNQVAMGFYAGIGEEERSVATWACFGEGFRKLQEQ